MRITGIENDSFLNILLISRYPITPDIYYYFRSYNDIEGTGVPDEVWWCIGPDKRDSSKKY